MYICAYTLVYHDGGVLFGSNSNQFPISFWKNTTVTWNPNFLPIRNPQDYNVDIELNELMINGSFKYVTTLLRNAPNSGSAAVTVPKFKTSRSIILGLFKVTQSHARGKRQVGGDAIPAEWLPTVVQAGIDKQNFDCSTWLESEPDGTDLLEEVHPCPPTKDQCDLPNSNFGERFNCFGSDFDIEKFHPYYQRRADICYTQSAPR